MAAAAHEVGSCKTAVAQRICLWLVFHKMQGFPSLRATHFHPETLLPMSLLFTPFTFNAPSGPLTLPNRIVVAPMCQYSADNGQASDWHLTHWTNLLNSGAGLFTIEATAVSAVGRISPGCLGLWDDATQAALGDKAPCPTAS